MRSIRREGMSAPVWRLDPFAGEELERVAFGDVVEAVEQDAALEALADLVDVVLDSAPRRTRTRSRRWMTPSATMQPAIVRRPALNVWRTSAWPCTTSS